MSQKRIVMNNYLSIYDIESIETWIDEALQLKQNPLQAETLGKNKTLGLLFFNNSLRTRMSTQKAAMQLGLNLMIMNFGQEGWALEYKDGTIMNQGSSEHIREAAQVISQYCDLIGIRAFANLKDRKEDEAELVIRGFAKHASVPIINLESSIGHPLQALADAITIREHMSDHRPRVVLSWAPHPKALPHAVANSFLGIMQRMDVDLVVCHPEGYELDARIVRNTEVVYDQHKALKEADFVYAKNWCSYRDYGKVLQQDSNWMITKDKLGNAKFMHCLPVRRNVVVEDAVLDSSNSLVIQQAHNRTYAAQIALKKILESLEFHKK